MALQRVYSVVVKVNVPLLPVCTFLHRELTDGFLKVNSCSTVMLWPVHSFRRSSVKLVQMGIADKMVIPSLRKINCVFFMSF